WRVTTPALSVARWDLISTMATFPEAPIIPDGGVSPVRFETLAFPLWTFPAAVWFKRGDAIRPYRHGLSTGSLHACHDKTTGTVSGHHAAHEAAKYPEPLCLDFGVTVLGEIFKQRQGSQSFYIRAHHASLPLHASDMLAVRIQAIDGEGTYTPQ